MTSIDRASRVLMIHPGALGDLIQAFPAFGRVRGSLPDASLALLTDEALAGLARATGLFDEVIGLDTGVAYHGGALQRLRLLARVVTEVRRWAPDRVGVFKGSPVYAAIARASGASLRVGLARGPGARMLTHPLAIDPDRHREDRYFDVSEALGADGSREVQAEWAWHGPLPLPEGGGPLIGIAPGGARNVKEEMPTRRWPSEAYAEMAARILRASPGARLVLLGGEGDRSEADVVRRALPPEATVDLVGRTSIPQARAVIGALSVFVGHDSGLIHLAGSTSTPVVAVFGPTDPRVACPRTPNVRYLWSPSRESPCYDEVTGRLRGCDGECCIQRVSVDEVTAAVAEVLSAPGVARPGW